ncbi:MAG: sigma-70 family RNA polymerase sigma factor [Planctomycetota bacterium]
MAELDRVLDVETEQFPGVALRFAKAMLRRRAQLDVGAYRTAIQAAAGTGTTAEMADFSGAGYAAEVRALPPMDRAEEFRMARRHEFVQRALLFVLGRLGIAEEEGRALLRQPAARVQEAVAGRELPRGIDADWLAGFLDGFAALRNLYVEGALYIVLGAVQRYRGLGVDTPDLIQEGNASLFQAIDGFDWRRDVRFRTYAQYWVQQAVLKVLYNQARTVRVPIWVQKILGKIRRAQDALRREGREPTHAEIGERIGVAADKVRWVLETRRHAVSIDAEVGGEDGASMAQWMPDDSLAPIPESIPVGDLKAALAAAMADLPQRERDILRRRFGIDGVEPLTLAEIAADYGITPERVRQLQNAALARLQKPGKLQGLKAFVE